MRGRHWLYFELIEDANQARRRMIEELNFPSTLAFASGAITTAQPSGNITIPIALQSSYSRPLAGRRKQLSFGKQGHATRVADGGGGGVWDAAAELPP